MRPFELDRLSIEQFDEVCARIEARDHGIAQQPRLLRLGRSDEEGDDW